MPACLPDPPTSWVITEATWHGSRRGGAATHLHTTRSSFSVCAPPPECSPWSPINLTAASGLCLLGFSFAGTVDHLPSSQTPSLSAAMTPPSPPSSAQAPLPILPLELSKSLGTLSKAAFLPYFLCRQQFQMIPKIQ